MKEKNNYDGEEQPLNEKQKINLDKTTIISMDNRSDNDVEYKLPKKQKLEFDFDFHDSTIKIADKEQNILKINKEYMESKLWYWKLDNRFKFNLPTTAFNEKKLLMAIKVINIRTQAKNIKILQSLVIDFQDKY